jgi:hypothetical protein
MKKKCSLPDSLSVVKELLSFHHSGCGMPDQECIYQWSMLRGLICSSSDSCHDEGY